MSTFEGIVAEFPFIRIDFFRLSSHQPRREAPLGYFLSHAHSDHLVGLETCKGPFVYCSPATRDIVLRLEKYNHRMNFSKGIVETRRQTYRHLKTILKAISIDTPTVIQLSPSRALRVTLIEANHCVGAVMFLIEGDGKAILYTGDIRAEPWWVEGLTRHPVLMPYAVLKDTKRLDAIYLDTTFATKEDIYRHFQTKAEGMRELLEQVSKYPSGTFFYFDAWTFGYEDVWQALAAFLGEQVHVDDYRYGMYNALANGVEPKAPEAAKLVGFYCGNHYQDGCLTRAPGRLHSCERGTKCDIWDKPFVRITPIVARQDNGVEIAELGAGGGHGDMNRRHELELSDLSMVRKLTTLCSSKLQGRNAELEKTLSLLEEALKTGASGVRLDNIALGILAEPSDAIITDASDLDQLPIEKLVPMLAKMAAKSSASGLLPASSSSTTSDRKLPQRITFPYSRHSSYDELCDLVATFLPGEIHPCTVDHDNWSTAQSMSFLFGHLYDARPSFEHDQIMMAKHPGTAPPRDEQDSQANSPSSSSTEYDTAPLAAPLLSSPVVLPSGPVSSAPTSVDNDTVHVPHLENKVQQTTNPSKEERVNPRKRKILATSMSDGQSACNEADATVTMGSVNRHIGDGEGRARVRSDDQEVSSEPSTTDHALLRTAMRNEAYHAALGHNGSTWHSISLVSVSGHQSSEEEL